MFLFFYSVNILANRNNPKPSGPRHYNISGKERKVVMETATEGSSGGWGWVASNGAVLVMVVLMVVG